MTKYKCGCESEGHIFMTKDLTDFANYKVWAGSVGVSATQELCLYCWLEQNNLKFKGSCPYKKGKWVTAHNE